MIELNRVIIDAKDILGDVGLEQSYKFERDFNPIVSETVKYVFGKPVVFDIKLENTGRGVRVTGKVWTEMILECSRCLREFSFPVEWDADEVFALEKVPGEETYAMEDTRVDLGPPVEEAVVLAVPMKPLCDDACAGICPVCGELVDEKHVAHDEEKVDARMEVLRQLLINREDEAEGKA